MGKKCLSLTWAENTIKKIMSRQGVGENIPLRRKAKKPFASDKKHSMNYMYMFIIQLYDGQHWSLLLIFINQVHKYIKSLSLNNISEFSYHNVKWINCLYSYSDHYHQIFAISCICDFVINMFYGPKRCSRIRLGVRNTKIFLVNSNTLLSEIFCEST